MMMGHFLHDQSLGPWVSLRPFPSLGEDKSSLENLFAHNNFLCLLAACRHGLQEGERAPFPLLTLDWVTELYRLERAFSLTRIFSEVRFLTRPRELRLVEVLCGPLTEEAKFALEALWKEPAYHSFREFFAVKKPCLQKDMTSIKQFCLPNYSDLLSFEEIAADPLLCAIAECLMFWNCESVGFSYMGRNQEEIENDSLLLQLRAMVQEIMVYGVQTVKGYLSDSISLIGLCPATREIMYRRFCRR